MTVVLGLWSHAKSDIYLLHFCMLHAEWQFPDDDCVCLRHLLSVSFSDERLQFSQMGYSWLAPTTVKSLIDWLSQKRMQNLTIWWSFLLDLFKTFNQKSKHNAQVDRKSKTVQRLWILLLNGDILTDDIRPALLALTKSSTETSCRIKFIWGLVYFWPFG